MRPSSAPSALNAIAEIERISAVPQILETVAHITGSRFTAVARVTDTSWVACATYDTLGFGLKPGGQLEVESTICHEIRLSPKPVIFSHASQHPVYAHHHTPKLYGLESYVSVPIFRRDGGFFGTLCAIDSAPANFDEAHILKSLELFALLIGNSLETEEKLQQAATELSAANDAGELRDQFIAVLGHDLRSPLQSISMATEMLQLEPQSPRGASLLGHIRTSLTRIGGLVDDVLDFARGRLGGGIPVTLRAEDALERRLLEVVQEVRSATGRTDLHADIHIGGEIVCDTPRLSQLFANLLSNAAVHGTPDIPVTLHAWQAAGMLHLSVHNGGVIAPEKRAKLFSPFSRDDDDAPQPGLGLGLYIAAEIAKAHAGRLSVSSDLLAGTTFTFEMPVAPAQPQHSVHAGDEDALARDDARPRAMQG